MQRELKAAAMMALATFCCAVAPTSQPVATLKNGTLWTDTSGHPVTAHGGGIFAKDGVYYLVGEHYGPRGANPPERGIRMYRSADLANWTDMGNVLQVVADPDSPITYGSVIERPKGLYCPKTGKFVLWFHNELEGQGYKAAYAGVAVADKVEGPYAFLRSERCDAGYWPVNYAPQGDGVTTRPGKPVEVPAGVEVHKFDIDDPKMKRLTDGFARGQDSRDMTVFLDDDGKAYHVYSSENNATLHVAELTDDYTAHTGRYSRIMVNRQREGACIMKHAGKYYLFSSGTTGWKPNPADVAVSDSVWGPYQPLGNPWQGPDDRIKTSFDSQSTYVLKIAEGKYIVMGDRWTPGHLDASPYVWAKVEWDGDKPVLRWEDDLDVGALLR